MNMKLPGRRERGRPKRIFSDVVKEDMQKVVVTEEDARDRMRWKHMVCCNDP